jgi:hypothetical protein
LIIIIIIFFETIFSITLNDNFEQLSQFIDEEEDIISHEKIISSFFDQTHDLPEFYQLPIKNISSILNKSKQTCDSCSKILENISQKKLDNAPLLLNSINVPNITYEECIKIISSLKSSPICVLLGKLSIIGKENFILKPSDFEPDIFQACEEGKLSSVQCLIQNGTNIEIKDKEIHSNFLLINTKILH